MAAMEIDAVSETEDVRMARVPSLVKPSALQGTENENVTPGPLIWLRPQPAMMTLDDRAADGQPDSHAVGFGRVERLEEPVQA